MTGVNASKEETGSARVDPLMCTSAPQEEAVDPPQQQQQQQQQQPSHTNVGQRRNRNGRFINGWSLCIMLLCVCTASFCCSRMCRCFVRESTKGEGCMHVCLVLYAQVCWSLGCTMMC